MMKGKYSIIFVLSQIIGPFFQKEVHKSAYVRGNFDKFAEKCKKNSIWGDDTPCLLV